MKSILVGNGINIQFGGNAYNNTCIMKRLNFRAELDESIKLFDGVLTKNEVLGVFRGFAELAEEIRTGVYDNLECDSNTREALKDFQNRYKEEINNFYDIMLEDYFFILHMYFLIYPQDVSHSSGAKQGFERLILDAIYNSGKIEDVYKNMNKPVIKFFRQYDNIFTLNYDNNLEKIINNTVYHLHGNFSELASSENKDYAEGYLRNSRNETIVLPEMEHCFCNALLNYSGDLKMQQADKNHSINEEINRMVEEYNNDRTKYNEFLDSLAKHLKEYELFMTKVEHPELKMATEYYFDKLRNIEGELYILGMSPNNDGHLFTCINNNPKITKVYFYCYSDKEKKYVEENLPHPLFEPLDVKLLWKKLCCERKKLNSNYKIEKKLDVFIQVINGLFMDEITKEQVIEEMKNITLDDIERLCILVRQDMIKRNPTHSSTDIREFNHSRASIGYIALQEGISPTTLGAICLDNYELIKDK